MAAAVTVEGASAAAAAAGVDRGPDSVGLVTSAFPALHRRYKKNLKALYVIHPTWWLNVCVGMSCTRSYAMSTAHAPMAWPSALGMPDGPEADCAGAPPARVRPDRTSLAAILLSHSVLPSFVRLYTRLHKFGQVLYQATAEWQP